MGRIIRLELDLSDLYGHVEAVKPSVVALHCLSHTIAIYFFPGRLKTGYYVRYSPVTGYYEHYLPEKLVPLLNEVEVYDEHGNPINPEDRIAEELSKEGDVLFIRIYNGYEHLFFYILLKQWGEGRWKKKLKT